MGFEKRKAQRLKGSLLEYFTKDSSSEASSFVKDISEDGVCFVLCENLPVGTALNFNIYLPSEPSCFKAKGKILWVKESAFLRTKRRKHYDAGAKFTEIDSGDKRKISEYAGRFAL
jgi:hypothetical protein